MQGRIVCLAAERSDQRGKEFIPAGGVRRGEGGNMTRGLLLPARAGIVRVHERFEF